ASCCAEATLMPAQIEAASTQILVREKPVRLPFLEVICTVSSPISKPSARTAFQKDLHSRDMNQRDMSQRDSNPTGPQSQKYPHPRPEARRKGTPSESRMSITPSSRQEEQQQSDTFRLGTFRLDTFQPDICRSAFFQPAPVSTQAEGVGDRQR